MYIWKIFSPKCPCELNCYFANDIVEKSTKRKHLRNRRIEKIPIFSPFDIFCSFFGKISFWMVPSFSCFSGFGNQSPFVNRLRSLLGRNEGKKDFSLGVETVLRFYSFTINWVLFAFFRLPGKCMCWSIISNLWLTVITFEWMRATVAKVEYKSIKMLRR